MSVRAAKIAQQDARRDQLARPDGEAATLARRIGGTNVDSVRTSKRLMMAGRNDSVLAAHNREQAEFRRMVGGLMS